MSWINNYPYLVEGRAQIGYNNTVVILNKESLQNMISDFDGLFDNIVNFTEEIANLFISPIKIPLWYQVDLNLQTSRFTDRSVKVNIPDYEYSKGNYFYLGSYYYAATNFIGYNGYTQIKVFLPYYGWVELDANDCANKYVNFRLMMDYYTGIGTYMVGVSANPCSPNEDGTPNLSSDQNMRMIGTWNAQILIEIPLGQSNISDIKRNIALGAVATAATLASGFPIFPVSQPRPASPSMHIGSSSRAGAMTSYVPNNSAVTPYRNPININSLMSGMPKPMDSQKIRAIRGAMETAAAGAQLVANTPCHGMAEHATSSLAYSMMTPYIHVVVIRPKYLSDASNYAKLHGKPTGKDVLNLKTTYGYTELSSIQLTGDGFGSCTSDELIAIEDLMVSGILFPDPPTT